MVRIAQIEPAGWASGQVRRQCADPGAVNRDVIDLTAFGFASFAQVQDTSDYSDNGADIILDFNIINLANRIVLKRLGSLALADLDALVLISAAL